MKYLSQRIRLLTLLILDTARVECQQLGLLAPRSIAVNNPGEMGLVTHQQDVILPQQQSLHPNSFIYNPYRSIFAPFSYPATYIQQPTTHHIPRNLLLTQSPFIPSYAYLIANNPYQMLGSGRAFTETDSPFNDLYHHGYVSSERVPKLTSQVMPNAPHQEQSFSHLKDMFDPNSGISPNSDNEQNTKSYPYQSHENQPTVMPTPPTFRTFQAKDYQPTPTRRNPKLRHGGRMHRQKENHLRETTYATTKSNDSLKSRPQTRREDQNPRPHLNRPALIPFNHHTTHNSIRLVSNDKGKDERNTKINFTTQMPQNTNSVKQNSSKSVSSILHTPSQTKIETPPNLWESYYSIPLTTDVPKLALAINSNDQHYLEPLANFGTNNYLLPTYPYMQQNSHGIPYQSAVVVDQAKENRQENVTKLNVTPRYKNVDYNINQFENTHSDGFLHIHSPTYKLIEEIAFPTSLQNDSFDTMFENNNDTFADHQNELWKETQANEKQPALLYKFHSVTAHKPSMIPTPILVTPIPSTVWPQTTTKVHHATAWPITPPPSFFPDKRKRPRAQTFENVHKDTFNNYESTFSITETEPIDDYSRDLSYEQQLKLQLQPHEESEEFHSERDGSFSPGLIPPIPPNLPMIYHPLYLQKEINRPMLTFSQKVRNYELPDLKEPENYALHLKSIDNYASESDEQIRKHDQFSGVYFSPQMDIKSNEKRNFQNNYKSSLNSIKNNLQELPIVEQNKSLESSDKLANSFKEHFLQNSAIYHAPVPILQQITSQEENTRRTTSHKIESDNLNNHEKITAHHVYANNHITGNKPVLTFTPDIRFRKNLFTDQVRRKLLRRRRRPLWMRIAEQIETNQQLALESIKNEEIVKREDEIPPVPTFHLENIEDNRKQAEILNDDNRNAIENKKTDTYKFDRETDFSSTPKRLFKPTQVTTIRPKNAAEIQLHHLRQHQQILQTTKLKPPRRTETDDYSRSLQTKIIQQNKNKRLNYKTIQKDYQQEKTIQRRQDKKRQPSESFATSGVDLSNGYSLEFLYAPFIKRLREWDAKHQ